MSICIIKWSPNLPELDRLKYILESHASVLGGSTGVTPKLKDHPAANFQMQPCRFRDGISKPLKIMLDQFVTEGVQIPGNSCHSGVFIYYVWW